MGNKKKKAIIPPSKPSRPAAVADELAAEHAPLESETVLESKGIVSPDYTNIKLECERALNSLRIGSHNKALRMMKDLCVKHENSPYAALIYRVHGTVFVRVASMIDDPKLNQSHLKNAIEAARRATSMSPNSIEFAHFYANLMYDLANEGKEYEKVVQECERALAIENPVDPGKERIQESQIQESTAEGRIKHVQNELSNLIQKSSIASISTWMKHLGNGDENFRLIPIRRVPEDPMELRPVQARRPNEITQATKTPEDRRKEIEVQVAAARLLMQKSELTQTQNGGDKGLDPSAGLGQRGSERRKSGTARKNASSTERRSWVDSYQNSITMDMKKELLRIRITDLENHFSLLKDSSACEVLSEALKFSEVNKTWKFWTCCRCGEKFADPELHIKHVKSEYIGSLSPKLLSALPQNVENESASMLLNSSWKPLDINAAVKLLEEKSKPQENDILDGNYQSSEVELSKDGSSNDESNLAPRKEKLGDGHNGTTVESRKYEKIADIERVDFYGNGGTKTCFLDDPERAKLLEKIRSAFQALIKNKCLAPNHLSMVMHFAEEELQGVDHGSQLLKYNICRTPLCIFFLGSQGLTRVLKFLQELSQSCYISRYSERDYAIEDENIVTKALALEKIVFSEDGSCLLFDEHFLQHKLSPNRLHDAVTRDKIAAVSSNMPHDNGVLLDSDAFLSWIFTVASSTERPGCWAQLREEKVQQSIEILRLLEKEFHDLQDLCERKCEHLSYGDALQEAVDLCLEEGKKREHETDFVCQSYAVVLKKWREELMENHHDVANISNRIVVEAISNVLNDVESLNVSQLGYEETYNGVTSHLCDLESGEDDDWRVKNSCVEVAIQGEKEHNSVELSKIDARILRVLSGVKHLELKLEPISGNDYRRILVPLVKSYLRAYLKDLAEKAATEKSDAAQESLLKELACDSKKSSGGGTDNPKHVTEKTKDKKKNKGRRKRKDSKASSGTALPIDHHETSEDASFQVANDGEKSENQEHECKLRIELEADEKMPEETLEYQKRIENEAKLKHIAEQHKKGVTTLPEKMPAEVIPDTCLTHEEERDTNEQLKSNKKVIDVLNHLAKNESPVILEDQPTNTAEVDAKRTEIRDEGIPEGDTLFSDQWSGRQSQKGPRKPYEGKNQSVSSGRGKNKVGALISSDHLQEKMSSEMGDSGVSPNEVASGNAPGINAYGTGLQNKIGENNCFLNVIIQSLWNLRRFRDDFLGSPPEHIHVGDPCVRCALYDIFTALSKASLETQREAVSPTSLRIALSKLCSKSNNFQEGQMNDASEVLDVIFDYLHRSFTSALGASDMKSTDGCMGSWDCTHSACIVHSLFGMNVIERMNCSKCNLESRRQKYTTFYHIINASDLRLMKVIDHVESKASCDPDAGGCESLNSIHHFLSTPPYVFTLVIGWLNECESRDDIRATLAPLSTEIDISVLYHGLAPNIKHCLVSVVSYSSQHFQCVAYRRDHDKWIVYNDQTVEVIGSWDGVLSMFIDRKLQPTVLFFEAKN